MFCLTAPWWFISLDFFLDEHYKFWFGFIFRKLYPGLKENLEQFRKHLQESSQEMAALKVWQLQGICCELCIELFSLQYLCKVLSYMLCNFSPVSLSQYLFLQRYFYNCVLCLSTISFSTVQYFLTLKLSRNQKEAHIFEFCGPNAQHTALCPDLQIFRLVL